jgi:hypothetical protein
MESNDESYDDNSGMQMMNTDLLVMVIRMRTKAAEVAEI